MDPENSTIPHLFFIFSAILFICKCNFFYGNVHWTLKWWCCCEGMELLLKWKNEMFCGRNEREWKKFDSLVAGTWNETGTVNEWKLISFIYGSWWSFPMAPACNTWLQLAATSETLTKIYQSLIILTGDWVTSRATTCGWLCHRVGGWVRTHINIWLLVGQLHPWTTLAQMIACRNLTWEWCFRWGLSAGRVEILATTHRKDSVGRH